MKKYLILLLVLPNALLAQTSNADSIKFEMIKETVFFYTADNKTFKVVAPKPPACTAIKYDCLKQYCDQNALTGVGKNIDTWSGISTKDAAGLATLVKTIIAEVTESPERQHRTVLPEYDNYNKKLNALVGSFRVNSAATPPTADTEKQADTKTDTIKNGPSSVTPSGQSGEAIGLLTWIALIAGLGGLALSGWVYTRKPKKTLPNAVVDISGNEKLEKKILELTTQINQKGDATTLDVLQKRIDTLESQLKQLQKNPQEAVVASTPAAKAPKTTEPETVLFYAKLPDLDNGFSNDILKKEQSGEQVYEIIVKDSTATYKITDNSAAQEYAINDANYILGRGCTLNKQPFSGCRISTISNGTLRKTAEGWAIDVKAVVDFV